jgi:hypothetical protein
MSVGDWLDIHLETGSCFSREILRARLRLDDDHAEIACEITLGDEKRPLAPVALDRATAVAFANEIVAVLTGPGTPAGRTGTSVKCAARWRLDSRDGDQESASAEVVALSHRVYAFLTNTVPGFSAAREY